MGAKEGIAQAYREHQDLLILALTGRTGSGCTTAANLLAKNYQSDLAAHFDPKGPELSKHKIVSDFNQANWVPFSKITVSALLLTYLAEQNDRAIENFNEVVPEDRRLSREKFSALLGTINRTRSEAPELMCVVAQTTSEFAANDWSEKSPIKSQITTLLPELLNELRTALGDKYNTFLQEVGDNIRRSGNACQKELNPARLFQLPKRIVRAIECIREIDKSTNTNTRIVLDAIRNPLELIYIRDRYSPLYAVAITANESDRKGRLIGNGYSPDTIESIDNREYPKKHDPYASYGALVTQDIQSCLQKADIFISNTGKSDASRSARFSQQGHLYAQLLRYCALALHPGLVTPTRDERCMQVAFIAKANSGCISRQVGAAVTDATYAVKAIGWNDVPKGQVPCALRNVDDLMLATDHVTYSVLERENDQLREHINNKHIKRTGELKEAGLPCSFCFKDSVNESILSKDGTKGSNQVHTRSLHAEENAFLQLSTGGGATIKGGKLFTTASPCELCSKKAYQLGIKDIIYIDPYPGISIPHVISTGDYDARPLVRLFSGAVGKAYHRVYEPMLPVKDELTARLL